MTNETEEVRNKIRQYIIDNIPQAHRKTILNNDALLDSDIVDSLGVLNIVIFVETEFGILFLFLIPSNKP